MYCEDITVDDFIGKLKTGQKTFTEIAVEDYNFTLTDYDLNEIEFASCFVNINFKNCSLRKSKFMHCNLKCISFENCDLTESMIDDCAIESLEMKNCNLSGINFGTNSAYGCMLSPADCLQLLTDGNSLL